MARLTFHVEIAAPPERVFAFFAPQRMPYWYGAEMDAQFEVAGGAAEFAVAQKVHIRGRLGRKEVSLTAVVTRYEPLRALEWRFHDAYGICGRQLWTLQPLDARTLLVMEDEFSLPGITGRLTGWLMRPGVAARDRRWLDTLRRLAERR